MMDMRSRNQYLEVLRKEYLKSNKKKKAKLLSEAEKRTKLCRKYLIRKLSRQTNFESKPRKKRKEIYDSYVRNALASIWEIFDYACGQRLASLLKTEIDRLRALQEISISEEVALKLKRISPATIDRKLAHQKEVIHQKRKYHQKNNPLLYQKIPIRGNDWDRALIGQEALDLVEHCGSSLAGEFIYSLSVADISSGWWEGQAVMGRGQERTFKALKKIRKRTPFNWIEIHPDNDTAFINFNLFNYCQKEKVRFSRSRPYRKNDNSFVEQKNSTHVRSIFGHLRYDSQKELKIINQLYDRDLYLYKNFFQPVMKLKEKIRDKGKVHRKYDLAQTPYQRIITSNQISEKNKRKLEAVYLSLNPAQLKRNIETQLDKLYKVYQEKQQTQDQKVIISKKLKPRLVTNYMIQPNTFRLPS